MQEGEEGRSLPETPTWSVATVITAIIAISFIIQNCISRLKKWLMRTKRMALLAALEEIVKEVMLFGLLSMLMGHWTTWFSKICVEERLSSNTGFFACFEEGSRNSTTRSRYAFCPEGLQPFASHESLEQLHHFVLVLGVVHVTYSVFLVSIAMSKIDSWRTWETQVEGSSLNDVKSLIIKHQSSFISQYALETWSQDKFLLYMVIGSSKRANSIVPHCLLLRFAFFLQFWRSIDKAGYMVMRYSFITKHKLHVAYNFHNYMLRSMEDEFRDIVGISTPLWGYAIIFILLNIHGTGAYLCLSYIPLALILIIGSKLHYIGIQLAVQLENENLINPHYDLFCFGRPKIFLWLIRLYSFQNTFEMATLIWSLWEIKAPSCFMKNQVFMVIRFTTWILFQFWCSYFTFPLYVITTRMGHKPERTMVAKESRDSLYKWSKRAKYHVLRSSFNATSLHHSINFMGDEMDGMDHASSIVTSINSSRQVRYNSSFSNPVFSPDNVISEKTGSEMHVSRVSNS